MAQRSTAIPHGRKTLAALVIGSVIVIGSVSAAQDFDWDWHDSQALSPEHSLQNAKLSKKQKEAIATAISAELEDESLSQQRLRRDALETSVEMVDLNSDGTPEVIAQGVGEDDCSPTGNCSILVFQKVHGRYKLLLRGLGQTFTIQKTNTNGFRDIVVGMHESAFDVGLTNYQYKGGWYHDAACYYATWRIPGTDKQRKDPQITPCQ